MYYTIHFTQHYYSVYKFCGLMEIYVLMKILYVQCVIRKIIPEKDFRERVKKSSPTFPNHNLKTFRNRSHFLPIIRNLETDNYN